MIAKYIEENNEEVFTIVELFENVVIEFKDEVFKGNYAIYTRDNNIIRLIECLINSNKITYWV